MSKVVAAIIAVVVFSTASASHGARAQYPSPVGSATLTVDSTAAVEDSHVMLTCEVRDVTGAPVAGAPCVFSIESEPGSDAAVGSKVVTRTTGADGRVTTPLYVGTTPGVIVVKITAGELSSSVLVEVKAVIDVASPPQSPVTISPPATGDAGLAGS